MVAFDTLISIAVILLFGVWAYSKVKGQSLKDTFEEIKDIISSMRGEE